MAKKLKIRKESFTIDDLDIVARYLHEKYIANRNYNVLEDAAYEFVKAEAEADIDACLGPKAKGKKHGRA